MAQDAGSERIRAALRAALDAPPPNGQLDELHAAIDTEFSGLIAAHARRRCRGEPGACDGVASALWMRLLKCGASLLREIADDPDPRGRLIGEIDGAAGDERSARVDRKRERHEQKVRRRASGPIPPPKLAPLEARADLRTPDPSWTAMSRDELEQERVLVRTLTQGICLISCFRGFTGNHQSVAGHYADMIEQQHAESVPLAAMRIGERDFARRTRFHRATNQKRLDELLAHLPPPLRDRAPRLGA